ncbi:Crp/Fnr family transcriptional regulator [Chitinophaga arvensicola]|uniref:cAMP-binding domain of CRP or a regulatory subunit of cAMP-dependent protein kinases n=1 Tax=Chitinophaga arvensicola TaxID=29529 RepID=A0A1I0REF7_9BACT|nr:Crp/Fnr family transcriptional regulator [Chitinophaga arvensicola]SEW38994.1 cAMP-binding domain of CRP or a regulatory subunit of cAMP-dependent protein kinases [Chitinophaga arvensicola]
MLEKLREHIEKIVPLTDGEFAFVSDHFTVQQHKKRAFLIEEGKSVKYTYFVISGLLMLVHNDDQGKQHIAAFAMEDWWESDFLAFYTQTKATMSLQCLEDTEVACLSLEGYDKLCAGLPKMEHFFLKKANGGHIASQQRILSFLTSNAKDRCEQLLKRYPSLFQRVPKTLLASYLGVSRETLSRIWRSS